MISYLFRCCLDKKKPANEEPLMHLLDPDPRAEAVLAKAKELFSMPKNNSAVDAKCLEEVKNLLCSCLPILLAGCDGSVKSENLIREALPFAQECGLEAEFRSALAQLHIEIPDSALVNVSLS